MACGSEWRLEKRENLSAPRPQRLLDCVAKVMTSFRTSGSLAFNGIISSLSLHELDAVFRNFGRVSHSNSARLCAFKSILDVVCDVNVKSSAFVLDVSEDDF